MPSKHRSIVITGAGSGLGRALALRYAREGWRVAVLDKDAERAAAVGEEVSVAGGEALVRRVDVTSGAALAAAARKLRSTWGGVDVVVANAGVAASGTLAGTPMKDWHWVFEVNVFGVVATLRAFLPMMEARRRGHVVAVASAAGFVSAPGMAAYNASKAAVISICESLRSELAPAGIGVSVACPSFFRTRLLESFRGSKASKNIAAKLMERSSLGADDVAEDIRVAVEKKEFMVVSHTDASRILLVKRFVPGVFHMLVRKGGARMLAAGGGRG